MHIHSATEERHGMGKFYDGKSEVDLQHQCPSAQNCARDTSTQLDPVEKVFQGESEGKTGETEPIFRESAIKPPGQIYSVEILKRGGQCFLQSKGGRNGESKELNEIDG